MGNFAEIVSLLDVSALADLFRGFHGEVDGFVRSESEKLFDLEARNQQARRGFQEVLHSVRGFLDEFAPEHLGEESEVGGSDAGSIRSDRGNGGDRQRTGGRKDGNPGAHSRGLSRKRKVAAPLAEEKDSDRDVFLVQLLPQFVRLVTDDERAMQDACELLATFVERHFRASKELMQLADRPSPVRLFRSLLSVLVAELGLDHPEKKAGASRRGMDHREKADRGDRDNRKHRGARKDSRSESSADSDKDEDERREGQEGRDGRDRDGTRGRDAREGRRDGRDHDGRDHERDRRGDRSRSRRDRSRRSRSRSRDARRD